ncbi:MAG TPA: hypothetical protein VG013_41565 [Gemmataceae bacterium]|nr:hypothetical protein [Gemmataceae bacterium]
MMCRHCGRQPTSRPRGLCWSCYYTPGLRQLYPSTSKYAHTGEDFCGLGEPPPGPTSARPGSPEKVAILQQRARLHQRLWHPGDAAQDDESRLLGIG